MEKMPIYNLNDQRVISNTGKGGEEPNTALSLSCVVSLAQATELLVAPSS